MRPLLLEIEGLQSYKEKQVINFEKLCENGLFGIFGETGSGKSTILDAMIFSLYGKIPRTAELDQDSKSLKNFLNTSSKKMEVYFKFALDEDIYEVSRKYALGKSKGEEVLKEKETILRKNGEIVADSIKKLEKIIAEDFGLSDDDFTRTVVLPQGKFSEFVKLKGADKREMLEKIFAMEKYGKALQDKMKKEMDFWKKKDEELEEELAELVDITAEKIEELEKEKSNIVEEVERKTKEHKEIEKRYYELKNLKEEIEKYNEQLERKSRLELEKESIEYIRTQLTKGRNANEIREYIEKLEISQGEKRKVENQLRELETQEVQYQEGIKKLEEDTKIQKEEISKKELEKSQIYFDKSEEDTLNEVIGYKGNLEYVEKGLERAKRNLEEIQKEIGVHTQDLANNTNELEEKERELANLPEVSRENLSNYRDEIEEYQRVIRDYREKKSQKEEYLLRLEELERKLELLKEEERDIDSQLEILEEKRRENLAYELAKELKEGEPCPVCGSIHHNKIEHNSSEDIEKIQWDLKKASEKKSSNIADIGKISGSILSLKESIERLEVIYKERVVDESYYQEIISDKDRLIEEYREEERKLDTLAKERERVNSIVIQMKEKCKNTQKNIEKSESRLQDYLAEIDEHSIRKASLEKSIARLGESFVDERKEELEKRRDELKANYQKIRKYEEEIASINRIIAKNDSQIVEIKDRLEKIRLGINSYQVKRDSVNSQIEELNKTIEELISKYHFMTVEEVRDSYISGLEEREYSQKIESYEESWKEVNVLLRDLESRVQGKDFSIELWEEISQLKERLNQEILDTYQRIEQISSDIALQKTQLADSKEKRKEQKEIRRKRAMAEDLYKKFSKGGFVNFLTTKKLKGVIENASHYITRITNGRYKLYTDDECNFYVIDMFNDGIKRKVGTLSGGEIFVVSLCLALALSKQLQLKGKIPLEFFFLDEGFGSLDSKLLDKVMEAIENIRREENIKIGIITHLEDLKVRIDRKLQVEKAISGERGTRVKII